MKKPKNNPFVEEPKLEFEDVENINRDKAKEQAGLLREALEYHNYLYYVKNKPKIADKAYDKLFHRLEDLEVEFSLDNENSPTQRVGGEPIDSFETVEHTENMLSLDSSENEEDVRSFGETIYDELGSNVKFSVEPKFDGISVEIVYIDGEFERAVTRGDGVEGEDISKNVKTIKSVPLKIEDAPKRLAVRGEIYMDKQGFHELNKKRIQENKEPFANPRNATAGTVRQLDPKVVAERPLDVYFYNILECSKDIGSQSEVFDFLKSLGFKVCDLNKIVDDIDEFIDYRNYILKEREELNYDVDGVVIKVNDVEKRKEMGKTARHPKWAFAYKFPPKSEETKIQDIMVQVGRTGKLTPVALLEPVDIQGVTVSRATLHNEDLVQERGITVGSKVKVERAGDVIPEVKEVVERGSDEDFNMPEECPICGSDVFKEGKYHYCNGGLSCKSQLIQSVIHYASKQAMDIEGLGDKVAKQLVEKGLVESLSDLYNLDKDDLTNLEKFAEKSANNLLEEIEKSKSKDLDNFLYGIGIRHIGRERARDLAKEFTLSELKNINESKLREVKDFGSEVSKSVSSFFNNEKNLKTIDELTNFLGNFNKLDEGGELKGLTFVITGSVEDYTRNELKDVLEKKGASVTSSVSSNTDYLIKGDNPGQRKQEQANENNVEIIESEEFKDKFL